MRSAHFEASMSWTEGYATAGWELCAGMIEAASGFVDFYHRAFNLSLLFPVHCT